MANESVIEKVKKILAKTQNNSNEHEVQTAILLAQEILVKYNLTMSDIELNTIKEKKVEEEKLTDLERSIWWITKLGVVIAKNFRCECSEESISRKRILKFYGLKEDVLLAKEVFTFSRASLECCSDSYIADICNEINSIPIRKRPQQKNFTLKDFVDDKNDYIKGFLKGLDDKFKEQISKNNWGLILVKDNAINEYTKKHYTHSKSIPSGNKGSGNAEHYSAGYKDGYSIDYDKKLLDN